MTRRYLWSIAAAGLVLATVAVHADVKTTEKTQFKLTGVLGALASRFGGQAAKDGVTSTVAVKGSRKSSLSDVTGQIIDLDEQKVYRLDVKKKQYTVKTFAEIRAEFEKDRADAQKQVESAPQEKSQAAEEPPADQMEFDVDVRETGQHKQLVGRDTHEVVVTLTGRKKGQKLEEGGGFVMTSDMWLAPRVAALDEVRQFDMKYAQAIYGETFVMDMQQMAQMAAMYPQFQSMAGRMQTEGSKVQGTPLSTTVTFESVKSADQMKSAGDQPQQPTGGGIGGLLGRRLMGKANPPQQRSTVMTTTTDVLSIDTAVSAADVAMPDGYKEKK